MNRPHGTSTRTQKRAKNTKRGYSVFFCLECRWTFTERTGTPLNSLAYPTAIVLLVVFSRLRSNLSFRDLAEMFLKRGFAWTHEAVRDWQARLTPWITEQLRMRPWDRRSRRQKLGQGGAPTRLFVSRVPSSDTSSFSSLLTILAEQLPFCHRTRKFAHAEDIC